MKILLLELQSYKRLALNNINYIRITPVNQIHLVLGSNGSGKSSILKELSPLPANSSDYFKEGYKYIEIEHNGSIYKLRSSFTSKGNVFSFIKDGEELNTGFTVSVYKELVSKEFNLTQDIHDVMLGNKTFHSMSVADRRSWMTKISDNNFDYAISYYQKQKEKLRDAQGAIKLLQSRLVQETAKLIRPEEEAAMRKDIVELRSLISFLLEMKTHSCINKEIIKSEIATIDSHIYDIISEIRKAKIRFINKESFTSIEDIDIAIINNKSTILNLENTKINLCKEIENLQQTLASLEKANLDSFVDIDKDIDNLNISIASLNESLNLPIVFTDNQQAHNALLTINEVLIQIASSLVVNKDRKFSRNNYQQLLDSNKSLITELNVLDSKQAILLTKKKELDYIKANNKLECPNCSHVWYKDYTDKAYNEVMLAIENIAKVITEKKALQNEQERSLTAFKDYFDYYRTYVDITQQWPILSPLWTYILNNDILFDRPTYIIKFIDTLKTDLSIRIKIDIENKKLKDLLEIKDLLAKNQELDKVKLQNKITQLNNELFETNLKLQNQITHVNNLKNYKGTAVSLEYLSNKLDEYLKNRHSKYLQLLNEAQREALNETIKTIQLQLNNTEYAISKIDIQKALVSNLESQLTELIETSEVLKIIVKELSPNEGLIAKSMAGFINHFVFKMNSFIKKVWLYPLELVPIVPENNDTVDLDYKFAVRINDKTDISDISLCSSAMKEIIDLAFKIVSMRYLKLNEAPLYLDELGKGFDKAHRETISTLIQNLALSDNFSQLFIISHYEEMYGSFKNGDITVLCPANISEVKNSAFNLTTVIQ